MNTQHRYVLAMMKDSDDIMVSSQLQKLVDLADKSVWLGLVARATSLERKRRSGNPHESSEDGNRSLDSIALSCDSVNGEWDLRSRIKTHEA